MQYGTGHEVQWEDQPHPGSSEYQYSLKQTNMLLAEINIQQQKKNPWTMIYDCTGSCVQKGSTGFTSCSQSNWPLSTDMHMQAAAHTLSPVGSFSLLVLFYERKTYLA